MAAPNSAAPHPGEHFDEHPAGRTGDPATGSTDPSGEAPDDDRATALADRWRALLLAARAGAPGPDPQPYGRDLLRRWAEPQRRYHTTGHLVAVLDRLAEIGDHATDPYATELAAWFHDAVYRPDRSENEERSAALAERALREAGVPHARTAEVARLVRLTVTHDPAPGDSNGEALCDADLAVLAGTPTQYARYAADVRAEYGFVPEETFRSGRAAVLRQLLALPRLYRTPYGGAHWEEPARHNLRTELALLGDD